MILFMWKVFYLDNDGLGKTALFESKPAAEKFVGDLRDTGIKIASLSKWQWKTEIED